MKRVSMGGTDVVVTDARVADLILEYAERLGTLGKTDTVTVPTVTRGEIGEAKMLLGPASQITVTSDQDDQDDAVELPDVDAAAADIQDRIDHLGGQAPHGVVPDVEDAFADFGRYDSDGQS